MIKYKEEEKGILIKFYVDNQCIGQCWIDVINSYLNGFEIYPPYQNKGYGQQVLRDLINAYHIKNLEVKNDNEKAKHIYEKLGFKYVYPKYLHMQLGEVEE